MLDDRRIRNCVAELVMYIFKFLKTNMHLFLQKMLISGNCFMELGNPFKKGHDFFVLVTY